MNRLAFIFLSVLFVGGTGYAQDPAPAERGTIQLRVMGPATQEPLLIQDGPIVFRSAELGLTQEVLRNAPYTATAVTESTQTLADGNRITSTSSVFLARDGQGRTRREENLQKLGALDVQGPKIILISDPVTHTDYVVQPAKQTVSVTKHEEAAQGSALELRRKLEGMRRVRIFSEAGSGENAKTDIKHEDLGMQDIEGLACHGRRETITIPAGQIGNERPLVTTTEVWTSDDLHGVVLKKHTDPRFGETTYRLTNIKLGEPDPSLFQVPSGYKTLKGEGIFSKD